jgi:hypothetical protein
MNRHRPPILLIMGACSCVFAAFWFLWLVAATGGDFLDLLQVAVGNRESLPELARHNLDSPSTVRIACALFAAQAALAGVLIWTGCALLKLWQSGRWSAVVYSGFAIAVALASTSFRLLFLTPADEPIKVTPLLLDALAILFANVLCGTMFLPEVALVYGGLAERGRGKHEVGKPDFGPQ